MKVIFVDNHLLVADKPADCATQPDLELLAKAWVKQKFSKPGKVFLEPIHRLDKPASGLVLFARTSKALSRLHALMRDRKISKTYYALVSTLPEAPEGDLEHYLVHDEFRARISTSKDVQAKQALLHYRLVNAEGLLEIALHTGRYHQIRAQLAHIGSPIRGDQKYGSKTSWKKGIALHHARMELIHPVTLEPLSFCSEAGFLEKK
jgi:23S rRNA pseudouridine1911/1915/1917 synthase